MDFQYIDYAAHIKVVMPTAADPSPTLRVRVRRPSCHASPFAVGEMNSASPPALIGQSAWNSTSSEYMKHLTAKATVKIVVTKRAAK